MNLLKSKKGIILEQHKEPALSREIRQFLNAGTAAAKLQRQPAAGLDDLQPEDIIEFAKEAGIVDERDSRPLWEKLRGALDKNISVVVADAIDDEPYISSQLGVMMGLHQQAAGGLAAAMKAVGAGSGLFAVYKNISDLEIKIPNTLDGYKVKRIRGVYPAENRIGSELDLQGSYLLLGVCSLVHLYRAIYEGMAQSTCFVTVAGNCIGYPTNLEVSIGVTVTQVLERCGLANNPTKVIVGGSMTGFACIDTDSTEVSPSTRGVLAFRENKSDRLYSCIGCGRCVGACPARINPMYIYKLLSTKKKYLVDKMNPHKCINCGICSYVCPAMLPISHMIYEYNQERGRK